MIDPNEDGITHINIYSKGRTQLGRLLSNFSNTPINIKDGRFESIEGYWYWLLAKDNPKRDILKDLYGFTAKVAGRELSKIDWDDSDEFKHKIRSAIKEKINSYPLIKDLLLMNKLPFKHYYVYGDKVVEPQEGKWVVEYFEQLKDEFKFEEI